MSIATLFTIAQIGKTIEVPINGKMDKENVV